ncbi:MAG: glycosyltransferase [Sphingomonadales bacterium]|nr:glycosyltransferase [Sphingomonadales bacterium]MBU3993687.1 glycosyltransferase [Alphaproteobacteria bacterium]
MTREAIRPFIAGAPVDAGDIVSIFTTDRKPPASAPPRRIALIGTYAPRKCGIATFTTDVVEQFARYNPEIGMDVYALDNAAGAPLAYDRVAQVIAQDCADDYRHAARRINESGVDAVWLQHEYGIFGGEDGAMVCDFADRLAPPLVLTLHTVLGEPSPEQERIVRHLAGRASRIMVMSRHARDLLVTRYDTDAELVEVIAHGAPDRPFGRAEAFKQRIGLGGRKVLMTFGLLGPGKGLERVIEALPAIVARHPAVVYRIVGATHPNHALSHGESYRDGLIALARELGVEQHIAWDNRFLETGELLDQLEACDIYITPYPGLQQATSGTLSYAVALGKAVVSTPYVHARELLADETGILIEPGSSAAIAEAVTALLDKPERLDRVQRRAYARGRATIWPAFAAAGERLVASAITPRTNPRPVHASGEGALTVIPGLSGVFAMSDATGMLQHAIGIVPDRRHGYCLDDNARALMLMNLAQGLAPSERARWSMTYASFVQHAWNPDLRRFRNFMNFDRTWCEASGSDDSNGRALWALGHTVENAPERDMRSWARRWFDEVHPIFMELDSPRTVAFAMLGAAAMLRVAPGHLGAKRVLDRGGALLANLLDSARRPEWGWFEAKLGYDNPRFSQALIEAGTLRRKPEWVAAGLETLAWIAAHKTSASGHFRPIGSETFGPERAHETYQKLPFDQQPLEAQAAVEAARSAYAVTRDAHWVRHARIAHDWFLGANDRGVILADLATGRCRDGVTRRGANENCGAESILAFQLAHYSMLALWGAAHGAADRPGEARESGMDIIGQQPAVKPLAHS